MRAMNGRENSRRTGSELDNKENQHAVVRDILLTSLTILSSHLSTCRPIFKDPQTIFDPFPAMHAKAGIVVWVWADREHSPPNVCAYMFCLCLLYAYCNVLFWFTH